MFTAQCLHIETKKNINKQEPKDTATANKRDGNIKVLKENIPRFTAIFKKNKLFLFSFQQSVFLLLILILYFRKSVAPKNPKG